MDLYIDNASEILDAIRLLEAAVLKADQAVKRASSAGSAQGAELLHAEEGRLRRELDHYRRLYAAQVAGHLRC